VATVGDVTVNLKANTAQFNKSMSAVSQRLSGLSKSMSSVGASLSLKLTAPLAAFGTAALVSSAKLETLQVSLESMTGSSESAAKAMKDLISFTAKTPFQLDQVGAASKQLLAIGVSTDNLTSKLKVLGDVAAGANVPLTDMASIFAKSKAKGKAMTEELLQLSDRGIPVISELSNQLGVSKDKIFEMASQGKISFDILERALISMTEEGGIFANQMEKQSGTLAGLFSTLKDNVVLSLGVIGQQLSETFNIKGLMTGIISSLEKFREGIANVVEENPNLIKMVGIFAALAAAIGPTLLAMAGITKVISIMAVGVTGLVNTFVVLKGAMAFLALNPFGLILVGITAAATGVYKFISALKENEAWALAISRTIQIAWENIKFSFQIVTVAISSAWTAMINNLKSKLAEFLDFTNKAIDKIPFVDKIEAIEKMSDNLKQSVTNAESFSQRMEKINSLHSESLNNIGQQIKARVQLGKVEEQAQSVEQENLVQKIELQKEIASTNLEVEATIAEMDTSMQDLSTNTTSGFQKMAEATKGWGSQLLSSLSDGEGGLKSFASSMLQSFSQSAMSQAGSGIEGMLGGLLGGGGGGLFGGGGLGSMFGGFFANGGTAPAGKVSVVGEKGPELIMPKSPMNVISNKQMSSGTVGGGQVVQNISVNTTIDARGADASVDGRIRQILNQEQPAIIKMAVDSSISKLSSQINKGGSLAKTTGRKR
jgi:tape measure domain-containing protein